MQIVYARQSPPKTFTKSIFLAGPTPRSAEVQSWRGEALRILDELGYDGVVFVPENESLRPMRGYTDQVEWEEECLNLSDAIVFWVPRTLPDMPAFTTNDEWGAWKHSGRCVFGAPKSAVKTMYQEFYARKLGVPFSTSLKKTLQHALDKVGAGAARSDGDRYVPSSVWNTLAFQQWYAAQRAVGNRLEHARVHWTFRVGPNRSIVYLWALHVHVHIAAENRVKSNEFVLGRPDISTVLLYRRRERLEDSEVLLIKEFRSTVRNDEGFVYELPGGSSFKPGKTTRQVAAEEVWEEAGLEIAPERLVEHGSRQVSATFASHHAHLFSAELTEEEMKKARAMVGSQRGNIEDSELTYLQLATLGEIRTRSTVDWAMLGMILSVLSQP